MPRPHIKALITAAVLLAPIGSSTFGQGFAAVTGRNHPELVWQVAETPHFRIAYPERLAGIEVRAAAIAEETYNALSHNLDVSLDEPIRIYLSDEDEISNGFASRLGDGWTSIWVKANVASDWTGPETWLRRVLSHEIAHVFHYRAVRSNIGLFDMLFANPLPRFWTEGLAQYQTERWDTYRGEQWLRTAVLEDRLSYRDGRSAWNGRLLYAVGNAQVRYLAEQYGDSTLARILKYRRPAVFGLAQVHDFDRAFQSVTGETYREFYDRWRRHVNIYYNTIAGKLEPADSLGTREPGTPGQYVYDLRALSDGRFVSLYLESVDRPVRRLAVIDSSGRPTARIAEGVIRAPITATPNGRLIAFSRRGRSHHGSLLHDIYLYDTSTRSTTRLTRDGRATSPALSPDGRQLAYVLDHNGTSNIIVRNLAEGTDSQLTSYDGGEQISHLRWHPRESSIAFYVFEGDGSRGIALIDLRSRKVEQITGGHYDDRGPVWSPDGESIGFTSLRDGIPNIFVLDLTSRATRRITSLQTGATLTDWEAPGDPESGERLLAIVSQSKESDRLYAIDARRSGVPPDIQVGRRYATWATHAPPLTIATQSPIDTTLIHRRHAYNAWKNISHVASIALPYFNSTGDWGVGAGTLWIEPLGKHLFGAAAGLSIADPGQSFFGVSYVNNQLRPSIAVTASWFPDVARPYGNDILREERTGASVAVLWPIDRWPRPYSRTQLLLWINHFDVRPLNPDDFTGRADGLPIPEAGRQTSLRVSFKRKTLRPYRENQSHPLDGWGFRTRITGAVRGTDLDQTYLRYEAGAYGILPVVELHRLYVHARYRGQTGASLPQDFVGLSRYDAIRVDAGGLLRFETSESNRVRGHRRLITGSNVLFGTAEYRIPLVPSLKTEILGVLNLGATTLAPFFDAGYVWRRPGTLNPATQLGAGFEIKNALRIAGLLEITQAIGFAQPTSALFSQDRYEIYYRVQSALPF